MIHKIAEKIINWQIIKGNLTEKEQNKYVYAYEILLNQLINLTIAMVLAFVSQELKAVLIFLAIYIPLRKYAGGFHAKSNERCIIYSTFIIIAVILLNKRLRYFSNGNMIEICFVLLLLFVWYVAPIEAKNKKLVMKERRKFRKRVHLICVIHISVMLLNVLVLKRTCISINILLGYLTLFGVLIITYKSKKDEYC